MRELRDTSQSPLHRMVDRHLQSFQAQIDAGDATLPRDVVRSLERLAMCGDAATGFTSLRCDGCGEHMALRAVVIHPPATTRVLQELGGRGPPLASPAMKPNAVG